MIAAASAVPARDAPPAGAAPVKAVNIRGWLFPVGDKQAVSLTLKSGGGEGVLTLASTEGGAVASNPDYTHLPEAGNFTIELKSGEKIIANQSIALRQGRHYTLVGWREGGRWQIKAFADDLDSANAQDRPLRVLNFAEGRSSTVALTGGSGTVVAADSLQELRSPAKIVLISVKVQSSDGGPPAQSSVEVDFSSVPCAYITIGPDYRGRMRPRVMTGGRAPEAAPEPASPGQG